VINERWRLNPQHFSNVRETQTHELPDLIEILVINREMEQLEFQKAYLLSVVWMPGLCKAQVESTFSTVHDVLSSPL
jgi:ribonuclease I